MEQGEERRNAEIVPEMELQGFGAINEGIVEERDEIQDFVDARNDPVVEPINEGVVERDEIHDFVDARIDPVVEM
ncbi:hypothetical protein Tco_1116691, partial [Tanacetum coccineum]